MTAEQKTAEEYTGLRQILAYSIGFAESRKEAKPEIHVSDIITEALKNIPQDFYDLLTADTNATLQKQLEEAKKRIQERINACEQLADKKLHEREEDVYRRIIQQLRDVLEYDFATPAEGGEG